jgi:bifunctional DNase/RNase
MVPSLYLGLATNGTFAGAYHCSMDVQVELSRILIRELSDGQIIELHEVDGARSFPIVVGLSEAMAIERRLRGIETPRPMTHDLLGSVIQTLGGRLDRVLIHEMSEGTFYAVLCIEAADGERLVDARPSDAIALALADDIPVYVSDKVLDEVQQQDDLTGLDDTDEPSSFFDDEFDTDLGNGGDDEP